MLFFLLSSNVIMRVEISVLNITTFKMIEERCIYSLFTDQKLKNHTLKLFNIYTELQYGII